MGLPDTDRETVTQVEFKDDFRAFIMERAKENDRSFAGEVRALIKLGLKAEGVEWRGEAAA
jgi:hypothetical protein|tara:strand:+ start:115 stop:297 length:183 start_codon:yes stop_codon:yes gene_type:complete